MKEAFKVVVVIIAITALYGCSLNRATIPLGYYVVSNWEEESCLLSRLTSQSRVLEFYPGHGKPYTVIFEIQIEKPTHCNDISKKINVNWGQLQIDELPDMGKSKIGLAGKARVMVGKKEVCQIDDFILAKSYGWYEVEALSIADFRPPENPQDPILASKEAFKEFIKKFTEIMNQECLEQEGK